MKKQIRTIGFIGIMLVLMTSFVTADVYQVNYTSLTSTGQAAEAPRFAVQVLKYDPYPVNPGDWFDIWIKAQNIGQNDAPNAHFELVLGYPFTTDEPTVQEFGLVSGISTALKNRKAGEIAAQENQVIIKYRLRVADNAPEGTSTIRFKMGTNGVEDTMTTVDLPISIGKTKTDFDVVMQDSTAQGTSFAIANTGKFAATAVTVSIADQDGIIVKGAQSSIIGNLDKGDFTTVTFQIGPSATTKSIKLTVAYTDISGVRNVLMKDVAVDITQPAAISATTGTAGTSTRFNGTTSTSSSLMIYLRKWGYPALGFVIGILFMSWYQARKRRQNEAV